MLLSRSIVGMLSIGVMVLSAGMVYSQPYPNKPVRIVTSAPGGGSDFAARVIAQGISGSLGQPVIVENRPTLVIYDTVPKAPPDGYTLGLTGSSMWIGPLLQKTSYDPVKDFAPISLVSSVVNIVVVHPSLSAKSVKELIALAKAKPGELNYAAGTIGNAAHLASELFKSMAGVNIVQVPYKGNPNAVTALIAGDVQMAIMDAGLSLPHIKSGKLRALAVTSAEPSALAPGLPTVAASGLPGYEAATVTAIFAPAKTPGAVINRLNQEIVRVLNRAAVKEQFINLGAEVAGSTPGQFAAKIKSEMARMGKVIKDAGIKLD